MPDADFLPVLPEDWEPTRATLHAYANGVSAVPRALAPAHPKWWHASLRVRPNGLVTDAVALPGGGAMALRMDLNRHVAVLETSGGDSYEFDMSAGATGTEFADQIIARSADLGLSGDYARGKFDSDDAREYNPEHATVFWGALSNVAMVLETHRRTLDGPVGPLQLWPHGFDLAMEWFGTKTETYEEGGEVTSLPAQLNLGFYPAGDAYFYSNPWPFDPAVTEHELPHGAAWSTEGFEGSLLRYADLAGDPAAATKLGAYAAAVFEAASPTLTA